MQKPIQIHFAHSNNTNITIIKRKQQSRLKKKHIKEKYTKAAIRGRLIHFLILFNLTTIIVINQTHNGINIDTNCASYFLFLPFFVVEFQSVTSSVRHIHFLP